MEHPLPNTGTHMLLYCLRRTEVLAEEFDLLAYIARRARRDRKVLHKGHWCYAALSELYLKLHNISQKAPAGGTSTT